MRSWPADLHEGLGFHVLITTHLGAKSQPRTLPLDISEKTSFHGPRKPGYGRVPHLKVWVSSLSVNRDFFSVYKDKEPELSGQEPHTAFSFPMVVRLNTDHTEQAENPGPWGKTPGKSRLPLTPAGPASTGSDPQWEAQKSLVSPFTTGRTQASSERI